MMAPRRARLAWWAAILIPPSALPAAAQTVKNLSAPDVFALADRARTEHRLTDAETLYRALARDPDIEIRSEARFRLGMMLADLKRYRDAAIEFRALLDEKPDAARVRLELARVLALMGDEGGARRQLRQAQSAGLPPDVATVVDQFANALRSTRRFGGSLEVSLAPDTNINRATSAQTLDTIIAPLQLSRDAREQSGLGLKLGGQGYVRLPVEKSVALLGRASAGGTLYRQDQFDDISTSLAAGPEITLGRDRLRPSFGLGWRYYGGDFYARTQSAGIEWMHVVGRRGQIETDFSAARARYALNPLQDGSIYDGSVAIERAFNPRTGGSITLSANRQTAQDPGYATASGGVSALLWRDIKWSTVYGTATYRHLDSDARLFLYPKSRSDVYYRLGLGVAFRKLAYAGLAPIIRAGFERNRSTVGIYDYRRLSVDVGVTRAF
jgi:tetratricopeptide (TPR) repeat protein